MIHGVPTLEGGVYIYQGSFGCTFAPPLRRRGDAHQKPDSVIGKVMFKRHAKEEFAYMQRFMAADPDQRYGVYAYHHEEPRRVDAMSSTEDAGSDAELVKCRGPVGERIRAEAQYVEDNGVYPDVDDEYAPYELLMDRATQNLEDNIFPHRTHRRPGVVVLRHLKSLANLFKGLAFYHNHGLVHGDIKPANIVMFGTYKHPTSYKFIDFGLSKSAEDLDRLGASKFTYHRGYYPYHPIASWVFRLKEDERGEPILKSNDYPYNLGQFYQESPHMVDHVFQMRIQSRPMPVSIVRSEVGLRYMAQDIYDFVKAYQIDPANPENNVQIRAYAAAATDIYALGIVTAEWYRKMTGSVLIGSRFTENASFGQSQDWVQKLSALIMDMIHMRILVADLGPRIDDLIRQLEAEVGPDEDEAQRVAEEMAAESMRRAMGRAMREAEEEASARQAAAAAAEASPQVAGRTGPLPPRRVEDFVREDMHVHPVEPLPRESSGLGMSNARLRRPKTLNLSPIVKVEGDETYLDGF